MIVARRRAPSVLRNAVQFGLGTAAGTAVAALTTVLVARSLAPAEWGNVALSASWALGVATFALFGLPQFATRELAAGRMSAVGVWRATVTCALLAAPATFALLVVLDIPLGLALFAAALSLVLVLRSGGAVPLVAAERFRWLGVASGAERLLTLVVAVLLLAAGAPLVALIASQCVGFGVVALRQTAGVVRLRELRPWSVPAVLRSHRTGSAFGVNALLFSLAQLDIVIVFVVAGATESGYFGVASRLVLPLAAVGGVAATVLLPRIARTGAARVPRRALWVAIPALIGVFGIGVLLLELGTVALLGVQYEPSIQVCVVYLASVMIVIITQPLVAIAQGCGLEKTAAWLLAGSVVVHLGGAAAGAVLAGAFGAAFGYLTGNLLLVVGLVLVLVVREKRMTVS